MEPTYELLTIVLRSVSVSGLAVLLSSTWSIPLALRLTLTSSKLGKMVEDLVNALTSIPTVVLGLLLYMLLSRSGPLGFLGLLYTPYAIVVGQAILVTPLITSIALTGLLKVKDEVWELLISLGAGRRQVSQALVREGLHQILSSILLGFNRALGELGVALTVGGNVRGLTRVMTTAIALEVSRGEYELAVSLGLILLTVSLALTLVVRRLGVR